MLAERRRHIEVEGWTPEHDDQHPAGEMVFAAVAYALAAVSNRTSNELFALMRQWWPWGVRWWKPKDRRRDLVRAGALIIAEIELIDRAELHAKTEDR